MRCCRIGMQIVALLALLSVFATAYNVPVKQSATVSRRQYVSAGAAAVVAPWLVASPSLAVEATTKTSDLTIFNDPTHGFSIKIPSTWTASEQELRDRRKLKVWMDPNSDSKSSLFIAYTPVRDDFTSLGSFGSVDQVASQSILPKNSGPIGSNGNPNEPKASMLNAVSKKQAYFFDYIIQVPGQGENMQHFRTIFTLQQGATGGAGAVLVTITAQAPEALYQTEQAVFDQIINSYDKST